MSLHKFAEQVAANGRGDDSLLVHMTPDEVRKLQQFAEANGTTLTINPETGLPEAGLLSDLFKTVAPIALGAFLGPAGAALGGGFMSAGMAGLTVGGLTTLATGSLSRGLMAGLGAYGGAGLGESLMGAGTGALSAEAGNAALSNAGLTGEAALSAEADQVAQRAIGQKLAAATPSQTLGAGFSAATASPTAMGQFAKQNLGNISAAAAPIMAGSMVPTTTKMPENTNPAYIRQKLYDPYTQTYKSLAPVKASEWGSRNFSDAYTNPQTGIASVLDQRKPTPMASGGIVALADGGKVQHFYIGGDVKGQLEQAYAANDVAKINEIAKANMVTADEVGKTWAGFDTSGIKGLQLYTPPSFGDSVKAMNADIAAGGDGTGNLGGSGSKAPTYTQYSDQDFANYLTTHKDADFAKDLVTYNADPAAFNRYLASTTGGFKGSTDTEGGSGTLGIYNQWNAMGVSPDEYYTAVLASNPAYKGWSKEDITRGFNLDKGAYALAAAEKDGVSDKEWVNFMDTNKYSVNDMAQAFGLSKNEVQRRYDAVKNAEKKVIPPITTVTGTGVNTGVIPGGNYGNATNPGDITTNPDGTVTVHPNIPYRPPGGFSGMGEVSDAYTKGGGSLGYKAKAPTTMAEFNSRFNKMTGDSVAAYDYLMGKGAGTSDAAKYPVQSVAATAGINRPYWSEGMRYKPRFLSYDEKGNTVSSTTSGKQGDAKAADLTRAKSIEVVDSSGYDTQTYTAVLQDDGTYLAGNGKRYDVTGKELAADGGMMGYAMGGGLGSLGSYSDGGRLLKGPGDGVSDSIPATIGAKRQPARLADGEFVIPARIVSELGNGSTEAGAKKLYAMMDRVQKARGKTTGKNKVAANSRADKYLPA